MEFSLYFPSRFNILVDGYISLNRYIILLVQVCNRHEFHSLYNFYVLSFASSFLSTITTNCHLIEYTVR